MNFAEAWHAVSSPIMSPKTWHLDAAAFFSFSNNPGHLVIETVFVIVIVYLLVQKSYKPTKQVQDLNEEEIDQLCREWNPEPLHPPLDPALKDYKPPVIQGEPGPFVTVNDKKLLNFGTLNFLGFGVDDEIKAACAQTIQKYGVGACGPRGFYGTIDVHLDLEDKLAKFMGTEEAILYSFDIATVSSAIPAFAKRGDLLVVDKGVSYAVQSGCLLSRSDIVYFKHNDMEDLERVLSTEVAKRAQKKLNRRFIIIEGIYANYGDIVPLDVVVRLKEQYKFRVIMDETLSIGVLGKNGRGCTEHFGVPVSKIEMITAGMGNALASVGGFACGSRTIVDHQRLAGAGYCFSAALPPFLATASIAALSQLEAKPQLLERLRGNAELLYDELKKISKIHVEGSRGSPILHLRLSSRTGDKFNDQVTLHRLFEKAMEYGLLLASPHYSSLEKIPTPPPSLRISASNFHTHDQIREAVALFVKAVDDLPAS